MKIILFTLLIIVIPLSTTIQSSWIIHKPFKPNKVLKQLSQEYKISLNLIHSIWMQESSKRIVSKRGKAGEYGPFQVSENAAKDVNCEDGWRDKFAKNAECGVKYLKHASNRCGNFYNYKIATFYNTGKCKKKPNGYSQEVMKRMLKV